MNEQDIYSRSEQGLSAAWSRVFLAFMERQDRRFSPFMVSIAAGPDGNPVEDLDLRHALDACLEVIGKLPVEKVAKTIFPAAIWRRMNGDRKKFYAYYKEYLPDYIAMAPNDNCYGMYFARLIGFGTDPKTGEPEVHLPKEKLQEGGNQIEFIIKACKPGAQTMALQAIVFDPVRDQVANRRGFPCLQHLSFVRDNERGTLSLNAFYALQSIFVKAYGNWLGLHRLGAFVADQAKLRFERLNIYAGLQQMRSGSRPKRGDLLDRLLDLSKGCINVVATGSAA